MFRQNLTARELGIEANLSLVPPMCYSYDFGMMDFVVFNIETDNNTAPDQTGSNSQGSHFMTEYPLVLRANGLQD